MFKLIVFVFIISISGCSMFPWTSQPEEPIIIHPDLPRPIKIYTIEWSVYDINGNPVVGTRYPDFLNLLDTHYDINRYIKQLSKSICFYRKELQEDFCMVQYKDKEEVKK